MYTSWFAMLLFHYANTVAIFVPDTDTQCFVFQWIGWLKPLLSRAVDDYHHVVHPQIAQISVRY
jgi:hypothetical protein